jgi:hypothetical protein
MSINSDMVNGLNLAKKKIFVYIKTPGTATLCTIIYSTWGNYKEQNQLIIFLERGRRVAKNSP